MAGENVRAEYAALIAYHNSIVTHRFTLAGFFVAAVGVIAKGGTKLHEAFLLLGLTAAAYIVERRNRDLYTQMSKRAMEIEEKPWGFNRSGPNDKTVPLFCRFRLDDLHPDVQKELPDELVKQLKSMKNWLRRQTASHSRGLDLLYLVGVMYAAGSIIHQLFGAIGLIMAGAVLLAGAGAYAGYRLVKWRRSHTSPA